MPHRMHRYPHAYIGLPLGFVQHLADVCVRISFAGIPFKQLFLWLVVCQTDIILLYRGVGQPGVPVFAPLALPVQK